MISDAESFLEAFYDMKRAVMRMSWRIFAALDLGPMQANLMRELSRRGAIAQAELARATASDPAAVSRAVQSLVDMGWVRRTPSKEDRRVLRVETTARGRTGMKKIAAANLELGRALTKGLDERDRTDFRRIAEKITAIDVVPELAPKRRALARKRSR